MSIPSFFNKIALRSTQSDSSPSYVEENDSGDLTLKSGSDKIKLLGEIEYEDDNGEFTNLKSKIGEISLITNSGLNEEFNVDLDINGTHPFPNDKNIEDYFEAYRVINFGKGVYISIYQDCEVVKIVL